MELHEIEKTRKVYKNLTELGQKEEFVAYFEQPLQELHNIIEDAV